jgi:hypothetical protein
LESVAHRERRQLTQCPVWPVLVVVVHILGQDPFQMPPAENRHPVEALPSVLIPADFVHPFRRNPYSDSGVFVHPVWEAV